MTGTRTIMLLCATAFLPLAGGCVSTPSESGLGAPHFELVPAESLKEVALEIERQVLAGNRSASFTDRDGIVVNDEAVLQAIRTRAARSELVVDFLETGHAWERRNGRIWIIHSRAYKTSGTRRDRDRDAVLVIGENQNRWMIYEGIVEASGWPRRTLSAVEAIFAQARVELLPAGIKYEDENGEAVLTGGG